MELPDDKAFAGSNVQAMQSLAESLAAFAGSLSATRHQTCTASTVCVWLCALLSGQGRPPFVDVQMTTVSVCVPGSSPSWHSAVLVRIPFFFVIF